MTASRTRCAVTGLLLLSLVIALIPVLQPLITTQITCGYDNTFHLWRAVQLSHLWDQGVIYSRWAPDMAHGFGFPLYLYASPFPPALLAGLQRMGLSWAVALNATFALGIVLGAVSIFFLARELFGAGAGLAAAVAYAYAPFQAYDVFNRGSLWEAFAWAWPPLVLLGIHRWTRHRSRRALVIGVGALAAMVLSHHPFAFLFGPVFVVWVLLEGVLERSWATVARGVLLGALAMGVTAFFWLPPLMERSYVQTARLLDTWVFDYHYNFISLEHLLALPRRADPLLLNDWPVKGLGLVPVLIGLLPLVGWRRLSRTARWQVVTLWGLTIVLALLTQPVTLPLWERISLLAYVQFPWRYLGPAALCLALLAGAGVAGVREQMGHRSQRAGWMTAAGLLVVVMVLIAGNLGWFYPQHCAPTADTTLAGMIAWERMTDTLGSTAKGEYLPIWVEQMPDARLDDAYAAEGPILRLQPQDLPAGAEILMADYDALGARIELDTPVPFTARYLAFYYPGWSVRIDGVPVTVTPAETTGLVTFPVPVGRHVIEVAFRETPLRIAADVVSVVTLTAVGAVMLLAGRLGERGASEPILSPELRLRDAAMVVAVIGVVVGLKLTVLDGQNWLWRSSRLKAEGSVAGVEVPLAANFGNQALLVGMDPLPESFSADASPEFTLYWRALQPKDRDWHVGLALVGADGSRQALELRPARWARTPPPVAQWPEDVYVRMDSTVHVPPGTPPGVYTLELSLFDRTTAAPASVLDGDGNVLGPALAVGQVTLKPPGAVPSLAVLGVAEDAEPVQCGDLALWDVNINRSQAAPGDVVLVEMIWEALAAVPMETSAVITLYDATGEEVRRWSLPPAATWWPTSAWQAGERWVGRGEVRVPGSLSSGEMMLALGLLGCETMNVQALSIEAPARRWTVPLDFAPLNSVLDGQVRLAGVKSSTERVMPGETLNLILAWEALAEMDRAYHIYVHLLDEDGNMLTQNDGEPAGWTRPTPGWAVGEVVLDARPLEVPATAPSGNYEVRVGLYEPGGQRLTTASGEDGIVVETVIVP